MRRSSFESSRSIRSATWLIQAFDVFFYGRDFNMPLASDEGAPRKLTVAELVDFDCWRLRITSSSFNDIRASSAQMPIADLRLFLPEFARGRDPPTSALQGSTDASDSRVLKRSRVDRRLSQTLAGDRKDRVGHR